MQFIKNYIVGKKLCRRYGVKFIGFTQTEGCLHYDGKVIEVNVFNNNFLPTLLHEIGHYVDLFKIGTKLFDGYHVNGVEKYAHKRITYLERNWAVNGYSYWELLEAEASASKFANRVMKGKAETFLLGKFRTYTGKGFKIIKSDKLDNFVSLCVKLENRIKVGRI